MDSLKVGESVRIIDKFSTHYNEVGKFDGIVDNIHGEFPDRPYRVIFTYENKPLIRFYRKIDIEKYE